MFKEDIERIGWNYIFNMIVKPFIQEQWIILTQISKKILISRPSNSLYLSQIEEIWVIFEEKLSKYKITNLRDL